MSCDRRSRLLRFAGAAADYVVAGILSVIIVYLSLLATSVPVSSGDRATIDRAIDVLYAKGFGREAFLLRHVATFRTSDNWLNGVDEHESAYAATNFPFGIITLYHDFYYKAEDDTERAMILLHEAQHMQGADERQAYAYVWRNRSAARLDDADPRNDTDLYDGRSADPRKCSGAFYLHRESLERLYRTPARPPLSAAAKADRT